MSQLTLQNVRLHGLRVKWPCNGLRADCINGSELF
jgi:hypothetical protein